MSKMLEVIEKSTNYKTGEVKLLLLDTNFSKLGKVIGEEPGKDWNNISDNDMLSKDLLQSLNDDQIEYVKTRLLEFTRQYNIWINDTINKVTGLNTWEYNFTSLIDWSSKYIPKVTPASYFLVLTDLVNAEKEMYDFSYFRANLHMNNNLNVLKEWSKTQNYTTSITDYTSAEFEVKTSSSRTEWFNPRSNVPGVTVRLENNNKSDKKRMIVSGLHNLAIGQQVLCNMNSTYDDGDNNYIDSVSHWIIKRESLSGTPDDGKITHVDHYITGAAADKVNGGPSVSAWSGLHSPHFNGTANLPFLKTRILI